MSKQRFAGMLIILLMIWSVIPTLTLQIGSKYGINNFMWTPIPFLLGYFLGKYGTKVFLAKKAYITLFT